MSNKKEIFAGIIIIGNEVLSGRTQDINTSTIASWLNSLGIEVKEVRTIPDDKKKIIDTVNELRKKGHNPFVIKNPSTGWYYIILGVYEDEKQANSQYIQLKNPNWNKSDRLTDEYMKMVQSIMGGIDEHERMRNKKKIKKDLKNNFILN